MGGMWWGTGGAGLVLWRYLAARVWFWFWKLPGGGAVVAFRSLAAWADHYYDYDFCSLPRSSDHFKLPLQPPPAFISSSTLSLLSLLSLRAHASANALAKCYIIWICSIGKFNSLTIAVPSCGVAAGGRRTCIIILCLYSRPPTALCAGIPSSSFDLPVGSSIR